MKLMRILASAVIATSAGLFTAANIYAADSAPATNSSTTVMKVVVTNVTGNVQYRETEDQPWKPAKEGIELTEGAEFRTGPRSSVSCVIPPDQGFTLDRLGVVKVAEAIKTGGKVKTELMMKYGRTRYEIEAAGIEHEASIRSPSGTLAVRGTHVQSYDQPPYNFQVASFTGAARFGYGKRTVPVGGKSFARATAGKSGAAETQLFDSVIDPRWAASRSDSDAKLIANEVSRGATLSFDPIANIPVITGGAGPLSDTALAQSLPGTLNFTLRWTGNADLNLFVTTQHGDPLSILLGKNGYQPTELLYPGFNLDTTPSGGRIAFDHRGGKNGGQEIAYWATNAKDGIYGFSVIHVSGDNTNFSANVFKNGQLQSINTSDGSVVTQLDGTATKGSITSGIILIPDPFAVESVASDKTTSAKAKPVASTVKSSTALKVGPTGRKTR